LARAPRKISLFFTPLRAVVGRKNKELWGKMNNFDIKYDPNSSSWSVTVVEDFTNCASTYKKNEVVLNYSAAGDKRAEIRYIIGLLVTRLTVHDPQAKNLKDNTLAIIPSDKFIPITVLTTSPSKVRRVDKMFVEIPPNLDIRKCGELAAKAVCPKYTHHVLNAYVSTIPSIENLEALRNKMAKGNCHYDIDPVLLRCTIAMLLKKFDARNNQMLPSVNSNTPYNLKFNPNAGVGFKHWNIPISRNKRNNAPFARRALARIIEEMKDYIGRSEDLIPIPVHTYTAKPEVRSFDAELGKIRLIGMIGQMHDQISKMVGLPFMQGFRRWEGCMIGCSIWSSFPYWLMYAMKIDEFNRIPPHVRLGKSVIDPKEGYILFIADVSGQDVSFKPTSLFVMLVMRHFWVNTADKASMDAFNEFFAFETAFVNAKVMQWFGQMWYIVLGIMTSGYHGTSDIDSLMIVMGLFCAILELTRGKVHPMDVFELAYLAVYGDDVVGRFPIAWLEYLGCDSNNYPDKLCAVLLKYGITLKPGETRLYKQSRSHRNKFFTHIQDDEVRSEGIHMLQRYFVKYDEDMKPLHPDTKNYAWILPWRKTDAYATRLATDAYAFAGKPGRDDERDMNPYLGAYVKAFGLLMDAGPNLTAHRLCKEFMSNIAALKPDVPRCSPAVARGQLEEIMHRLDLEQTGACLAAITDIYLWDDKISYNFVCSKMGVKTGFFDKKFPFFKYARVADIDYSTKMKPYLRNGNVYYQ